MIYRRFPISGLEFFRPPLQLPNFAKSSRNFLMIDMKYVFSKNFRPKQKINIIKDYSSIEFKNMHAT
jgi:hypothetical protein